MKTRSTMISTILNVSQSARIVNGTENSAAYLPPRYLLTSQELDRSLRLGMGRQWDAHGIASMLESVDSARINSKKNFNAAAAASNLLPYATTDDAGAQLHASKVIGLRARKKRSVFNLTTTIGEYIANGIIVHNCDALAGAYSVLVDDAIDLSGLYSGGDRLTYEAQISS
jgi:hypothetical protein